MKSQKNEHSAAKKQGSEKKRAIRQLGEVRQHLRKPFSEDVLNTAKHVRQASINQMQDLSRLALVSYLDQTKIEDVMAFIQKNPSALFDYKKWRQDLDNLAGHNLINLSTADKKNLKRNQFKMNIFNKWLEAKKTAYQGRPLIEELKKFMITDHKITKTSKERRHLLSVDLLDGSGQLIDHAVAPRGSIFSPIKSERKSSLRGSQRMLDRMPLALRKQAGKLDDPDSIHEMVSKFYQYECDWQKMHKKIPLVHKYVIAIIQLLLAQPGLKDTDHQSLNELSILTQALDTTYQDFLKHQQDWKAKKCSLEDVSQSFEKVSLKLNLINKQSQFIEHMIETYLKQTPEYKRVAAAASASTPQGPTNVPSTVLGEIQNGVQWGATHEIKCLEILSMIDKWLQNQNVENMPPLPVARSLNGTFDSVCS